jgi:glutathione synthase/RimK-type ligase-like ATP-grasp enzyme
MSQLNLAFYCYPKKEAIDDFRKVGALISARAPEIKVSVLSTASVLTPLPTAAMAMRPTLSIEMDRLKWLRPLRGTRLVHRHMGKIKQLAALETAGLPIPKWVEIVPGTKLDPAVWGPYVVVKPSRGARGAFVRITKTGRVRYKEASEYPEDHAGRRAAMIAQQYVHTGRWPTAYRVLTYLGRPLAAIQYEGRNDLKPVGGSGGFRSAAGASIVASAKGCTIALTTDQDVLDLAVQAHALFPTIPSLGVDILRDASTGKLFLIEINPSGDSWMLSGTAGRGVQQQFGLNFYEQFGALDIIAEASIEAARKLAV